MNGRGTPRDPTLAVFATLFVIAVAVPVLTSVPRSAAVHTAHGPIFIEGNGDFTPANGVVGGIGTAGDPYIIEGWEIAGSPTTGISVRNTTAHFLVRDVYVHGSAWPGILLANVANVSIADSILADNGVGVNGDGVFLHRTANARIEGNNITKNAGGISVWNSANVTVRGNAVHGYWHTVWDSMGVLLAEVHGVTIANNTIGTHGWGIYDVGMGGWMSPWDGWLQSNAVSTNVTISGNLVTGIRYYGMFLAATDLAVTRNVITNNRDGLALVPLDVEVSRNNISWNSASGVLVSGWNVTLVGLRIRENEIAHNGVGLSMDAANGVRVYRNNFVDNAVQATDSRAGNFLDDGCLGGGGNFWSDYAGVDAVECATGGAGTDGFGDAPHVIDTDTKDRFPRMIPVPLGGNPPGSARLADAQLTGTGLSDVTLTWGLSSDDGAGAGDVVAYSVYESTDFDPQGAGYALLATLPPGTTTYTISEAGVGDGRSHFYRLVTKDESGLTTASADQFAKYVIHLAPGEHLLSIPVRMSDIRIETVLQTVAYSIARTYVNPAGQGENWLTRVRNKPWGDLTTVDEAQALWLDVDAASDLVVAGIVPASVVVHLEAGWNLVGYASFADRRVGEAFASASVWTVEGFDASNAPYYLRRLEGTDGLHAGDGLWVLVGEAFDWILTN